MPKVRQDAWSHEDDLLLAETVLRHIREGSTQLKAFDEVGDLLNRTSAACGFRWNAEVRQKYEQAVELAKKQRKEKKRKEASHHPAVMQQVHLPFSYEVQEEIEEKEEEKEKEQPVYHSAVQKDPEPELHMTQVIRYLKSLQKDSTATDSVKNQLKDLETENAKLKDINLQLNSQLESMSEDYQALIQIMDRARKMVMFDEQDYQMKPHFRMEKNGNLENVAR